MTVLSQNKCALCAGPQTTYRVVDGVNYMRCETCASLIAEDSFILLSEAGKGRVYDQSYWEIEMSAARERGFGASLIRVGELFHYARRPLLRILDISCGSGALLDAVSEALPELSDRFWGVEPFPPPAEYQSQHSNYRVSFLDDIDATFDGGVCIEVIEHLTPSILRRLVHQIARVSNDGALWYFNSSQPTFVEHHNPGYLDPHVRGHIASYSIEGLRHIFSAEGLVIHQLPGRDWAFLAEKASCEPLTADELYQRVWTALPENLNALAAARFGSFVRAAGLEGARCYLEVARADWAINAAREASKSVGSVAAPDRKKSGRISQRLKLWLNKN